MIVDPVANPYRPGAGRRPPVLAGRQGVLDSFEVVRRRAEETGEGDRAWVLNGLRGVGKTVLLNELLSQVSDRGWIAMLPCFTQPVASALSTRSTGLEKSGTHSV